MLELSEDPVLGLVGVQQMEMVFRPESCNASRSSPWADCYAFVLLPIRLTDGQKGLPFNFGLLEQEDIWGLYFHQIFDRFNFWLGPHASAIARDYMHYLPGEGFGIPPLVDLPLVFLLISIVD